MTEENSRFINSDLTVSILHSDENCETFSETFNLNLHPDFIENTESKKQNITSHARWLNKKIKINHFEDEFIELTKWKIVLVDFWMNIWSELNWIRPAIIYKASSFKWWENTTVLPITSLLNDKWEEKWRNFLDVILPKDENNWIDHDSLVKVSQLRCVDKKRFRRHKKTNKVNILWTITDENIKEIIDQNCKIMFWI